MKFRKSMMAIAAAAVTLSSAITISAADYSVDPGYQLPPSPPAPPASSTSSGSTANRNPAPPAQAAASRPAAAETNVPTGTPSAPVELIDSNVNVSELCSSGEPIYASYKNAQVKSTVLSSLAQLNGAVLNVVTKRYTIAINSDSITELRDINLGMTMTKNSKAGAMVIRTAQKGEYGCTVSMIIEAKYYSQCKINLNKASVYYVDEAGAAHRMGKVILDDTGNIVVPMTFGGKYIIK